MKILHLNTYENMGGAALAANRLHKALQSVGADSHMGVAVRQTEDASVHSLLDDSGIDEFYLNNRKINGFLAEEYPSKLTSIKFSPQVWHSSIYRKINELKPDIIHMHWIVDEFIPTSALRGINAPVVWTLHDTWAFTGGCHYFGKCNKFKKECGACFVLNSNKEQDISYMSFKQKEKVYAKIQPTIVTLSKRFKENVLESTLLGSCTVKHLPNCVNTDLFSHDTIARKKFRETLNIAEDTRVILFGADGAMQDLRKGPDLLAQALEKLKGLGEENIVCLVFGSKEGEQLTFPTYYLGRVSQDDLPIVYSSADMFICPSREDNLPNTIMESLSCATPVVGFDVGGIPDMVEHLVSGYIAKAEDVEDLAKGMQYVLADEDRRKKMRLAARKTVEDRYSMAVVAKEYLALYEEVLQNKKKA